MWTQCNLFLFTSWDTGKVTRQALSSLIVFPISELVPFVYRRSNWKLCTECRNLFCRSSEWIDKIEWKVCLTPEGQKWIIDGERIVSEQAYHDNSSQHILFSGNLHTLHIGNLYQINPWMLQNFYISMPSCPSKPVLLFMFIQALNTPWPRI